MRSRDQAAIIIETAAGKLGHIAGQIPEIFDIRRPRTGKIAILCIIIAFFIAECLYQFGNKEIGVRPACAVRMREHVNRDAVYLGQEIGAVIEIETAQVILAGLAFAAMLRGDQAGHGFQDFTGTS